MSNRLPEDPEERKARERERLTAHRGLATWGERLVPLGEFRAAAARAGRHLSPDERAAAVAAFQAAVFQAAAPDPAPAEGPFSRIAVFGGVYNNSYALEALLEDAARRG
ncbi:MAG TPA: hypothetical protein VHU81_02915, partial [Thermoanaerobaculia bacterium]|nr:hypothetical protein [Thermoanaerobaculia bacterium]